MAETSDATRYRLLLKIASGGVATVWIGSVRGGLGFRQLVAIKKPHPHLFDVPSLRDELITEARLASMIQHGNVVDVRDVDADGEQINLVMDYIEGASLAELIKAARDKDAPLPPRIVLRIILDACAGLHAAHDLVDETGKPVGLVHRDVSPQNILVGLDGISRVTDFGIAKAIHGNDEKTDANLVKGKLGYMSPEYLTGKGCDRRVDVFALGVVCWEALARERCFKGESDLDTANRIIRSPARLLSEVAPDVGSQLDDVLATAMDRRPDRRFPTMRAFATALESSGAAIVGSHADVASTVKALLGDELEERRAKVRAALADDPTPSAPMIAARDSRPSDSRAAEPVELTSSVLESEVVERPPAPDSDRRRKLSRVVAAVCAVAVLVLVIGVAASSRRSATPPVASVAASAPEPPVSKLAQREEPIPPPLEPTPEPEAPPTTSASAAPHVGAAPPSPRLAPPPRPAPAPAPSNRPGKPVPPNPYRH